MWELLTRWIGACLLLVVFASTVRAETGLSGGDRTLGLKEAVAKTMAANPELLAFGYELQAQDGRVLQAGLAPNPELSFTLENVLGSGEFSRTDAAEATLSIAWILERGVRQRRLDAAHAGVSLLAVEADIKRLEAAAETARLFFLGLSNQARLVSTSEAVQLAQETVQAVRKRVLAGKSPQAELARAQAELARMKLEHEDIQHELLSGYRRLAAQWGRRGRAQ